MQSRPLARLAPSGPLPIVFELALPIVLACLLLLAACSGGASTGASASRGAVPSTSAEARPPIAAQDAVSAIDALEGDITCADPAPRADDFGWICSGKRGVLDVSIHVFAASVDGDLFGVTIYLQAPSSAEPGPVNQASQELALDVVEVAVPQSARGPVADWIVAHMPDGGRTQDVPGSGVTAAAEPLARNQWYFEVYELAPAQR